MKINQADIEEQAIKILIDKLSDYGTLTQMLMDADDYSLEGAIVRLLDLTRDSSIDLRDEALEQALNLMPELRDEAKELIIENNQADAADYADNMREEEQGMAA